MPTTAPPQTPVTQDTDLAKLLSDVEEDLLSHIVTNMNKSKLTIGKAQSLAKDFLALLPATDKGELLKKLSGLRESYSEALDVFVKYSGAYEEEKRNQVLTAMRDHNKNGDIEKAIEIAKGGT